MENDIEYIPEEEVTADIEHTPPTDEEVLASFVPAALRDGAILVELKTTEASDIKSAIIVTLHEEQCPLDTKPEDSDLTEGVWCWNMRRAQWYYLKFKDVDGLQPFPPEPELIF